jgi:hypothetical protein
MDIRSNDETPSSLLRSEKKLHGNSASSLGHLVYGARAGVTPCSVPRGVVVQIGFSFCLAWEAKAFRGDLQDGYFGITCLGLDVCQKKCFMQNNLASSGIQNNCCVLHTYKREYTTCAVRYRQVSNKSSTHSFGNGRLKQWNERRS